jgi:hypothetical protein
VLLAGRLAPEAGDHGLLVEAEGPGVGLDVAHGERARGQGVQAEGLDGGDGRRADVGGQGDVLDAEVQAFTRPAQGLADMTVFAENEPGGSKGGDLGANGSGGAISPTRIFDRRGSDTHAAKSPVHPEVTDESAAINVRSKRKVQAST